MGSMTKFVSLLLPLLLKTLSDACDADAVVLCMLQVLAGISLGNGGSPLLDDQGTAPGQNNQCNIVQNDENIHGGLLQGQKDEK